MAACTRRRGAAFKQRQTSRKSRFTKYLTNEHICSSALSCCGAAWWSWDNKASQAYRSLWTAIHRGDKCKCDSISSLSYYVSEMKSNFDFEVLECWFSILRCWKKRKNKLTRCSLMCANDFGLSPEQVSALFSGPAFAPWNRMGNLKGWMGPLPTTWIEDQRQLQKKIVARMREFGCVFWHTSSDWHWCTAACWLYCLPSRAWCRRLWHCCTQTLPSPTHQTEAAPSQHRSAGFLMRLQFGWSIVLFLDPADPLFRDIQVSFLKRQAAEYGTDHLYNCDLCRMVGCCSLRPINATCRQWDEPDQLQHWLPAQQHCRRLQCRASGRLAGRVDLARVAFRERKMECDDRDRIWCLLRL